MSKVITVLKRELKEMIAPVVYFYVAFHIMILVRAFLEGEYGITLAQSTAATISALLVSKAIMLTDVLPMFRWFVQIRLIYNIIWRALLYLACTLLFLYLEELIPLISKYGSFISASEHLVEEVNWFKFWSSGIVLTMFLSHYSFSTGMMEAVGKSKILHVLFSGVRVDPKNIM
jgi:uncharacterized membrane protein